MSCKILNCKGKHKSLGYCEFHYRRFVKGTPLEAPKRVINLHKQCLAPNCKNKSRAKGYCELHYRRVKNNRDINYIKPPTKPKKVRHRCQKCNSLINTDKALCFKCYRNTEEYLAHRRIREASPEQRKVCYAYQKNYKKINPKAKLIGLLRKRLRNRIQKIKANINSNTAKIREDLGCSVSELKSHLEAKFQPGMSWDNHGEWHIDHIIPISLYKADGSDLDKKILHYTNLQPLWAKENIAKSNKLKY